jgi:deazaflavin-dependent oxidoreductase (nitroreductase family)
VPAQAPPLAAARATRPGRWLRRVLRLPILLYRWKLGWLLGHRFLLLTHVGRRTGLARKTVLEVLRYDPDSSTAVVMAGFGRRSDWYLNLQQRPALEVAVGRRAFRPSHRQLTQEEAVSVMAGYERRNRLAAPLVRVVLSRLLGWRYDGSDAARRRLASERPLVALWPDTVRQPVTVPLSDRASPSPIHPQAPRRKRP